MASLCYIHNSVDLSVSQNREATYPGNSICRQTASLLEFVTVSYSGRESEAACTTQDCSDTSIILQKWTDVAERVSLCEQQVMGKR